MMHNGPSGVLSSCDLRLASRLPNNGDSSMVKQPQTHLHSYHQHSDSSSRSSSVCSSSSLSPKTSSPPAAPSSSTAVVSTAPITDIDPQLAQHVEYELGLTKKNGTGSGTRKNAWGNLSYAELISKAITSSAEQRLTLAEIYDWMIKYVPFFRNKVDRTSSAGWKNSIRHNLSLHNRFKRVQSEGTGKSSWWIINPDEKIIGSNGSSSSAPGVKQPRRRHGPAGKSPGTTAAPKRLRATRSTKGARALTQRLQQQQSASSAAPSIVPIEMNTSVYDAPQWTSQSETDGSVNQLYEAELYATSVNTPTTNSSGNSIGCLPSNYAYDDPATSNYVGNSSSTNPNSGDYSYHHGQHHFHHHLHQSPHPPTLYQHHLGSTYELGSTNSYYLPHSQGSAVLTDHPPNPCSLSIDTYHPNASGSSYVLAQQQNIDPTDEQQQQQHPHLFLRVLSTSPQSSNASLSPPINANLLASSSSGGYLHPNSNGTLTLYSHHHLQPQAQQHQQHLGHHPHTDIESLLHLNADLDELDDDDDEDDDAGLSTFVHHHHQHGVINEHLSVPSFYSHPVNPHHSHHDGSAASILRTVLKRPIVGENVRLSSASSNISPL